MTFDEEHLTWDFPRMLEFCAAKGRIIVVIDGLEMLHLVERQDNLRWLPLNFPGNVRVILSFRTSLLPPKFDGHSHTFVTEPSEDTIDDGEQTTQAVQRMHAELFKRRQLPYLTVKPLRDAENTLLAKALCELPYPRDKKAAKRESEEDEENETPEEVWALCVDVAVAVSGHARA